jgi:outer membrane protein OmpA-like peptidoglycan-associated protein
MNLITQAVAIAATAVLTLAGCAHARTPVDDEWPFPHTKLHGIALSDDIRKICRIEETEQSPRFEYDSSDLTGLDRTVLSQVARCLTTGPLRGQAVQLIGRADPRGETEYNMTLGEMRAGGVHKYLVGLGVPPSQMTPTSRGELDATGTDEEGWELDRRVDMRLVAPVAVSLLTPAN